jgi:hypothetical protein
LDADIDAPLVALRSLTYCSPQPISATVPKNLPILLRWLTA